MYHYLISALFDSTERNTSKENCELNKTKIMTSKDVQLAEKNSFDLGNEAKYSHMYLSIM